MMFVAVTVPQGRTCNQHILLSTLEEGWEKPSDSDLSMAQSAGGHPKATRLGIPDSYPVIVVALDLLSNIVVAKRAASMMSMANLRR